MAFGRTLLGKRRLPGEDSHPLVDFVYDEVHESALVTRQTEKAAVILGAWSIKHLAVSRSSIWMRTDADALVLVDREIGAVREFKIPDRGYPGAIHEAFGLLSLANSASETEYSSRLSRESAIPIFTAGRDRSTRTISHRDPE